MPKQESLFPPYQEESNEHPGIDPNTGFERSVLAMLGKEVERWKQEGSLNPELPPHDTRHDPDRDGWSESL